MTHPGDHPVPEMPLPSPWVMGLVSVGAGVTLCWLATTTTRSKESPWQRWPGGISTYRGVSWALGGAFMIVMGLVILGSAIAHA